jgi:hypothetical protein
VVTRRRKLPGVFQGAEIFSVASHFRKGPGGHSQRLSEVREIDIMCNRKLPTGRAEVPIFATRSRRAVGGMRGEA